MLPILFQSPDFILYSYPLLMGIGWGVAYQIFFHYFPAQYKKFDASLLFWGSFLFAWIGAKLLFLLTSESSLYSNWSFWTGGGFVFYGGFLGVAVFLGLLKLMQFKLSLDKLWAMLPALVFGHAIGRAGCFLAGCCFGAPSEMWWSIHLHGVDRHPTQLLEMLGLLILGWILVKQQNNRIRGFVVYLIGYGLLRLGIESLRGDIIRGSWAGLTPSQWISFLLIAFGVILAIYFRALQRPK